MECFDKNILKFDDGSDECVLNDGKRVYVQIYNSKGKRVRSEKQYEFKVELPEDLKCKHCLFQVND